MPDRIPDQVWTEMIETHEALSADRAAGGVPAHRPKAAILACSDARVPPSVIFGEPAGSLFVVRLAGNSATPGAVASLTYAVEELGTDLVIVLGHTRCGAVTAAFVGVDDADLAPVVAPIASMLEHCSRCETVDAAVTANVRHALTVIARHPGSLGRAVRDGRVALRGAVHDLATGHLTIVDLDGLQDADDLGDPDAHDPGDPDHAGDRERPKTLSRSAPS